MYTYESPFQSRYGSRDMRIIFSPSVKYSNWRYLWLWLARGEQKLGLDISDEQIEEMRKHIYDIPFDRAAEIEQETHHDVMSHIRAYAEQCPEAAPIIHLGATSAFVTDNSDVMVIDGALGLVLEQLHSLRCKLSDMADTYKYTPTLAYTHFQPAQPTTFGKRVCMWLQDLDGDYDRLKREKDNLRILGCKGATGTCASFMELFGGNYDKIVQLDEYISSMVGIRSVPISGQTYSRKQDYYVFSVLSGIAQTLSKIANDLRLMSGKGEFYEPFGNKQVGSSAMAYKQNPLRCEKVVSLARLVINNATAIANTAANQWLERSLDDSAIRRILIPETFLMIDEMLTTMIFVVSHEQVQEGTMMDNINREIPKMVTEGILMEAVKKGGNRQELHEAIRQYTAMQGVWDFDAVNDFFEAISKDTRFNLTMGDIEELIDTSKLVGASIAQVLDYLTYRED